MNARETAGAMVLLVRLAVREGWSLQPWKLPAPSREEQALLADLDRDMAQEHPAVSEDLKVLRLRDANYRALSNTVLGMYGLSLTLTVLIGIQSPQAAGIFGLIAGITDCLISALMTGLHRLREVTLPPVELRLHSWGQLLGIMLALASLGLLLAGL